MISFWAIFRRMRNTSRMRAVALLPAMLDEERGAKSKRQLCARGLACILLAGIFAGLPSTQSVNATGGGDPREISAAVYRKHLEALDSLVVNCQKQRSSCDPMQVGEDERVRWTVGSATEVREIRYGWLRLLLERAAKEEPARSATQAPPGNATKADAPPLTVSELMKQARERLAADWKQAGEAERVAANRGAERKELETILARREFQGVRKLNAKDQFMEKLNNWLNELLERLARYGKRSPWIGTVLRGMLLTGALLGLGWGLLQLERRSRLRVVPQMLSGADAPSAREWQLWLKDAHAMAAQGLWREGIHFVYWAAISRLESNRVWPADRARTAREYLALVPNEDPRKASLATLTASFERTWYGGREADPESFRRSLALASQLGVE